MAIQRFDGSLVGANGSILTYTRPPATVVGHVMLVVMQLLGGTTTTITPPAGWVLINRTNNGTDLTVAAYYKIATAAEPATYDFILNAPRQYLGGIATFSGVDLTNPFVLGGGTVGSGTALSAPSITPVLGGGHLFTAYARSGNGILFTTPTDMTELYDLSQGGGVSSAFDTQILYTVPPPPPTGIKTSTASTAGLWAAQSFLARNVPVVAAASVVGTASIAPVAARVDNRAVGVVADSSTLLGTASVINQSTGVVYTDAAILATAHVTNRAAASLIGAAFMSDAARVNNRAVVDLYGTALTSAAAQAINQGKAFHLSDSTLSAYAQVTYAAQAVVTAIASTSAITPSSGNVVRGAVGTLASTMTVDEADAHMTYSAASSVSSDSQAAVEAFVDNVAVVDLSAVSTVWAASNVNNESAGFLFGTASVDVTPNMIWRVRPTNMIALSVVHAGPKLFKLAAASIASTGTVVAASSAVSSGAKTKIVGKATVSARAGLRQARSLTLVSSSTCTAYGSMRFGGKKNLVGTAATASNGRVNNTDSGVAIGKATVVAMPTILRAVQAAITADSFATSQERVNNAGKVDLAGLAMVQAGSSVLKCTSAAVTADSLLFASPVPAHFGQAAISAEALSAAAASITIKALAELQGISDALGTSVTFNGGAADALASADLYARPVVLRALPYSPTALLMVPYRPTARLEAV